MVAPGSPGTNQSASVPVESVAKSGSPRNRTLSVAPEDEARLAPSILELSIPSGADSPEVRPFGRTVALDAMDRVIRGEVLEVCPRLERGAYSLLVADPPYNFGKDFGGVRWKAMGDEEYEAWTGAWLDEALPLLRPGASIYVCGDWRSSSAVYRALSRRVEVRNRIVWEREKGRAATANWKSAHEEIWYAVVPGAEPYFNREAVRVRRRVLAPYRDQDGGAKDWIEAPDGRWRDTAPSNCWTDLSVPFWSMPENTSHPTQKPEKLAAKLILASTKPGDAILDLFSGSGTTSVVARKLGRHHTAVEAERAWCLIALKRLEQASAKPRIQGFEQGVFLERNAR
ncbi:MAG: site-specific DNA-methyltransferase [Spirochaetales bacterium]|nr:site-specific DNA-methyltransferase [Spirochaetales bacterium]